MRGEELIWPQDPFSMWGAFLLSTFQIKGGKLARREVKDRLVQEPDGFTGGDGARSSWGMQFAV